MGTIEYYCPPERAPLEAIDQLKAAGITVTRRQMLGMDNETRVKHCRLHVSDRQHGWAEEVLFVANGWTPALPVLDRTRDRMARKGPDGYDLRWRWGDGAGSGDLYGWIMDVTAPLFGYKRPAMPKRRPARVGRVGRMKRR